MQSIESRILIVIENLLVFIIIYSDVYKYDAPPKYFSTILIVCLTLHFWKQCSNSYIRYKQLVLEDKIITWQKRSVVLFNWLGGIVQPAFIIGCIWQLNKHNAFDSFFLKIACIVFVSDIYKNVWLKNETINSI